MLVIDVSVLVVALSDDGADGDRARRRLAGERLAAPELLDLEVLSVIRRLRRAGLIDERRAALALTDLAAIPVDRASHRALIARCWELRDAVSAYDAAYVALAEELEVDLLTGDRRLARAAGLRCRVELMV